MAHLKIRYRIDFLRASGGTENYFVGLKYTLISYLCCAVRLDFLAFVSISFAG